MASVPVTVAGISATKASFTSPPSSVQSTAVSPEIAVGMKRTYRYLSRRGFLSLTVIHPIYQAIRTVSNVLQLLREYAYDDHIEFSIPLSRVWPFRQMTLALNGDALTLAFPSLPSFIRKKVKFDSKTDPLSTFRKIFYLAIISVLILRSIYWVFWVGVRWTYRLYWALIRCWSGTLRTSLGSAPALLALFVIVFTTGDAWRFFGLEPTYRFLILVFALIFLSVAALIAAVHKIEGGWQAKACKLARAEESDAMVAMARKTPAKRLLTPETAVFEVPASVAYASPWVQLNIYALFWFTLLSHLISIGVLVAVIFMLIGLVAVNPATTGTLVGGQFKTYWKFHLLGQPIILSKPLVLLSITLACIAMLTVTSVSLREERGLNNFIDAALVYHRRSLAALVYYLNVISIIQEPNGWPEIIKGFDPKDQEAAYKASQEILLRSDASVIGGLLKLARRNRLLTLRGYGLNLLAALPGGTLRSLPAEDAEFVLTLAQDEPDFAARAELVRSRFQATAVGHRDFGSGRFSRLAIRFGGVIRSQRSFVPSATVPLRNGTSAHSARRQAGAAKP